MHFYFWEISDFVDINPFPDGLSELLILTGEGETTCSPKTTVMDTFLGGFNVPSLQDINGGSDSKK